MSLFHLLFQFGYFLNFKVNGFFCFFFLYIQEIFTNLCKACKETYGEVSLIMDNASYHKMVTNEESRMSYWLKVPAKEMKARWEAGEACIKLLCYQG